jgi:proteasome lid subunit RPN8/RPN11
MSGDQMKKRPAHSTTRSFEGVPRVFTQSEQLKVKTHIVQRSVLDLTHEHLCAHGAMSEEGAVCWAGTIVGDMALVTTVLRFIAATSYGGVHVTPESSGVLYAHLYARGLTLLAQVHSHPADAYHSSVDERSPHSPEPGFLSVVVPNFGSCSFDEFSEWAVFEQIHYEAWREWSREEKQTRLQILDTDIVVP